MHVRFDQAAVLSMNKNLRAHAVEDIKSALPAQLYQPSSACPAVPRMPFFLVGEVII